MLLLSALLTPWLAATLLWRIVPNLGRAPGASLHPGWGGAALLALAWPLLVLLIVLELPLLWRERGATPAH